MPHEDGTSTHRTTPDAPRAAVTVTTGAGTMGAGTMGADTSTAAKSRRNPLRAATPPRSFARSLLVSLAIHGGIASAILGTAWGVAAARRDEPPPVVLTADFFDPAPRAKSPADPATPAAAAPSERAARDRASDSERSAADLAERLRALEAASSGNAELDALARRFGAATPATDTADAGVLRGGGASFAGLVAGNATKVAYVVDASGSMIGSFPAIVDEVARSIAKLEPSQQFTVLCFRRDGAEAPGSDARLRPASRAERDAAVEWLRHGVVPSGRSSPVAALSRALESGADCVFLLSTTVTGPGRHELDRDGLLALLERLNPKDARSGRRRATIQCIQFLEVDPGGTLEAVAREHFGPGGYRFVSREDSGLDPKAARDRQSP